MATTKWATFAEAASAVQGNNPYLVVALNVVKTRPCPPPPWDPHGVYQVALVGDAAVVQRLGDNNTWEAASLHPPADHHMNESQKRLTRLKARLEATDSWPWNNIEAWVSSATPLIKRGFGDFYDEFMNVTKRPSWTMLPRFSSGGSMWDGTPPRDNFASAAAAEDKSNRKKAEQVKLNTLAFLEGLLDLPPADVSSPAPQPVSGHTIHAQGDVNIGDATKTTFNNSSVGAAATAPAAVALGQQLMGALNLKEDVKAVQQAVIDDQDKLDAVHELLSDALSQLLRSVRKIEFEQSEQGKVVTQIKASVDDIWVKNELEGVKVPAASEVAKAILASPLLAAALKAIVAG